MSAIRGTYTIQYTVYSTFEDTKGSSHHPMDKFIVHDLKPPPYVEKQLGLPSYAIEPI